MPRFKALDNIPLGSLLEVWEELTKGHVQIDGLLVSGDGVHDDRTWTTGQLLRTANHPERAGRKRLSADSGYFVRVSTFCEDDVEGTLIVQVVKPDGTDERLTWDLAGQQGDNHLNGAFIFLQ